MTIQYCSNCGGKAVKGSDVCQRCGQPYDVNRRCAGISATGAGGTGWSGLTGMEPCFVSRHSKTGRHIKAGAPILCAVAFIGMFIYTKSASSAAIVALLIAAISVAVHISGSRKVGDWEGTVVDKKQWTDTTTDENGNTSQSSDRYKLVFRTSDGRTKKDQSGSRTLYDYLQVGDTVRFHGTNMRYYEKYDKSRDSVIPCAGCGMNVDARSNYCPSCGCIIFKSGAGQQQTQPAQPAQPQTQQWQQPVQAAQIQPAQPAQTVQPVQAQQVQQPAQTAQNPAGRSINFCSQCGAQVAPGARFCSGCGAQLQ